MTGRVTVATSHPGNPLAVAARAIRPIARTIIKLVAFLALRLFFNLAAAVLAVIVSIPLFMGLRALQRLGRPHSDRRTFSDLPDLVHGSQEMPDQADTKRSERPSQRDA